MTNGKQNGKLQKNYFSILFHKNLEALVIHSVSFSEFLSTTHVLQFRRVRSSELFLIKIASTEYLFIRQHWLCNSAF